MHILISGGSGLIGQALTNDLIADGHEVVIISRTPDKFKDLPVNVKTIGWEIESLIHTIENTDAVVNLVGARIGGDSPLNMRWTSKRKKEILESRVNGGKLLSEAIRLAANKPKVFIQQSGVGYYGTSEDELFDETSPQGEDFLAHVSHHWENSTLPIEAMGIRRVITRTGVVFTRRKGIFSLLKLPFTFFIGGRLGSGKQYLSWIHIDDLVRIFRFLIDKETMEGIFNATSPNPVMNADFAKSLGKAMNRPSSIAAPAFAFKLVLGEASTLILDGQRVLPTALLESGYQFKYVNLEDALSSIL
ncbi:TIGR01777 family oxidoreductase [Chloroflexota bacterium]